VVRVFLGGWGTTPEAESDEDVAEGVVGEVWEGAEEGPGGETVVGCAQSLLAWKVV